MTDLSSNVLKFRAAELERSAMAADPTRANKLWKALLSLYQEIRSDSVASDDFLRLLQDENAAVRVTAAAFALEFAPGEAERVLEAAAASQERGMWKIDATFSLKEWRAGRLQPFLGRK